VISATKEGSADKSIFALRHERKISPAYPGTKVQIGSLSQSRKKSNGMRINARCPQKYD